MPNPNKARGKYFENKIVEAYRDTLNLSKLECYRSGSSGARTSLEITGDVSFNNPFKYQIITECKYRLSLDLDDLYPITSSEVDEFIEQNQKQEMLYIKNIPSEQVSKTNIISTIIMGRPHQKIEKYYTLVTMMGPMDFSDSCKIYTYSSYLNEKIIIVPFSSYLEQLKPIYM